MLDLKGSGKAWSWQVNVCHIEVSRLKQFITKAALKFHFLKCGEWKNILKYVHFQGAWFNSLHFVCKGNGLSSSPQLKEKKLYRIKGDIFFHSSDLEVNDPFRPRQNTLGNGIFWEKAMLLWALLLDGDSFPDWRGPVRKAVGDAEMWQLRGCERDTDKCFLGLRKKAQTDVLLFAQQGCCWDRAPDQVVCSYSWSRNTGLF